MTSKNETANDASIRRLSDVVAQVAGPALAILAVASVAFFLVEVTYAGPLVGRVKWIFALFSFAAVLISRISIEEGYERATGYGFFLGIVTIFVTARFMQGNVLVLALILAFIWWMAGRLTWDCTFMDRTRDASGQGMIDLAIDRVNRFREGKVKHENLDDGFDGNADQYHDLVQPLDSEGNPKKPTAWDHFVRIFFRRRQPNTPGLWAFYFLVAGLPLFGIGQLFLGMKDSAGRWAATVHFSMYVLALLGLLMLSSILGLHRHLKKNRSAVPAMIARKWIVTGTMLALGIVGFCLLLPRPAPQYSLNSWIGKFQTNDLSPSEKSTGRDGQEEGKNSNKNSGPKSREGRKSQSKQRDSESQGGNKQKSDKGQSQDTEGGKSSGGKSKGKQGSGGKEKSKSKSSGNKDGKQSKNSSQESSDQSKDGKADSQESKGESPKEGGEQREGADKNESDEKKGLKNPRSSRNKEKRKKGANSSSSSKSRSSGSKSKSSKSQEGKSKQQSSSSPRSGFFQGLTGLIKAIFWMIALAAFLFFAIRHRHQLIPWLHSFLTELLEFWNRLFGGKKKKKSVGTELNETSPPTRKLPSFTKYRDPFASGAVEKWPSEKIIVYSFEALQAWAQDMNCSRGKDQTAHEFADQVGEAFEPLKKSTRQLAALYTQLAYAKTTQNTISRQSVLALAEMWNRLSSLYSPGVESAPPT